MKWDHWAQFKAKVKQNWEKLTDEELDKIAGRRDQLASKIQEFYGISRDEAEKQVNDWESAL